MNANANPEETPKGLALRVLPDFGGLRLLRRVGERIVIEAPDGTLIIITMHDIQGGKGQVQVLAPPGWRIDREEVWTRRERERIDRERYEYRQNRNK